MTEVTVLTLPPDRFIDNVVQADVSTLQPQLINNRNFPPHLSFSMGVYNNLQVIPLQPTTNDKDFYWRTPLLPKRRNCPDIPVPFVPPTQIDVESIRFENVEVISGQVRFEVHWDSPMFINGDLDFYELCVRFGGVELEGAEDCNPSFRREVTSENFVTPDTPSFALSPLPIEGPEMNVQVYTLSTLGYLNVLYIFAA